MGLANGKELRGSMPALVTPFKDGEVDEATLRALVDWHIAEGSHGLVPVGTTGESPTLSHAEHERVVEIVVDQVAGRVPVIAGAGSNNTAETVRLVEAAKAGVLTSDAVRAASEAAGIGSAHGPGAGPGAGAGAAAGAGAGDGQYGPVSRRHQLSRHLVDHVCRLPRDAARPPVLCQLPATGI